MERATRPPVEIYPLGLPAEIDRSRSRLERALNDESQRTNRWMSLRRSVRGSFLIREKISEDNEEER